MTAAVAAAAATCLLIDIAIPDDSDINTKET